MTETYQRVYGLDPDEQPVADAVRASMAIPFFFRPVTLTGSTGLTSTLADGGLLSNFRIDSLDRSDLKRPRWPTFGVTVLPNIPRLNDRVVAALKLMRLGTPPLRARWRAEPARPAATFACFSQHLNTCTDASPPNEVRRRFSVGRRPRKCDRKIGNRFGNKTPRNWCESVRQGTTGQVPEPS